MANRNMRNTNTTKVEALIESCRSEGKWQRVIELTDELKTGSPHNDNAPAADSNFGRAKSGLAEARRFLHLALGESGQKAGIALDAYLLLAKLCFACGEYEQSLDNFVKAELNTLAEKELTLRSLKILAESYAIKGLCLEQQTSKPSSKFKKAEKDTEMISCFERATDLGLLYLQEYDIVSGSSSSNNSTAGSTLNVNASVQPSSSSFAISSTIPASGPSGLEVNRRMGAILETALQRAPITEKLQEAVERYRIMLNAIETRATQSLRLTLARQLAEVLLRGVSGTVYTPPFTGKSGGGTLRGAAKVILLLLIAEALAVRDTVLSQSPEFRQARQHAMGNVTAVYDLLTLATVRWGLVQLLNESFEKAFGEQHVWRQYGLSLMAAEKHSHALRVLQESMKLTPGDPLPCLLASRLCYESLETVKQGLDYAQQALKREVKGLRPSRSQLFVGIGHQQLAIQSNLKSERDACHKLALDALERAVQLDGNDHLAEYYLSLQYALLGQLAEALTHIQALGVVEDALHEFPDNLQLLHVKSHLQLHLEDAETALSTVQHMLAVWRDVYEAQLAGEEEKHSDTKSGVHLAHSSQMSDKDSNSVYAASLAAVSRVEQALSEAASSLSSFTQRPGPRRPWMLQIEIWLLLADVYLRIDQPNEALNCIHEASQIYPLSHQIMFMRGQVHVYLEQWFDAKQCFLNAVAANPNHTEALRALGQAHLILGEPRLAEKMLKDAAKLDPSCPKIWFALGKVMETLGDFHASADCFATSLQLEPSCPVLPFTSIPESRARSKAKGQSEAEHLQLLEELELADSCCEICHCDCYSSHSGSSVSGRAIQRQESLKELLQLDKDIQALEQLQRRDCIRATGVRPGRRRRGSPPTAGGDLSISRKGPEVQSPAGVAGQKVQVATGVSPGRSSIRRKQSPFLRSADDAVPNGIQFLGPLNDAPALTIIGRAKSKSQENMARGPSQSQAKKSSLCSSMANLCLAPTVRAAFQLVPTHDQKILNRMAGKRSQQAADKETAWLARKFWENERLERQLLRVEQLEAYKQAVHDKQFQDFLLTKARLQSLAERDLAELKRLRGALDAKDAAAKKRLEARRLERDLNLCQRRCEELRRSEAVTVQQEEQHLDETLRKRDICMRLTQRLRRADELRNQLLEAYLKRMQHDNYLEQVHHEEHWRERQQEERLRRDQLRGDIERKRHQSQRFVQCRQRRQDDRFRTAKISASLRELVRQSVTPEGAVSGSMGQDTPALNSYAQQQLQLGRLLFDQSSRE
ncbi:hypothetical protein M5D96_009778 [Drosophila gunungcola]|uniref:Tetratricopeptide repeat protein 7 N-terminal domain-containing protein n=1 Tax=Drosophila gunungcola TaxID=103775 RepID=A0A9P9YIK8_9MUSC|nr:hypothetical protein M5D96_009778 [Drosophila gunungcola]